MSNNVGFGKNELYFYENELFDWIPALQSKWKEIRAELIDVNERFKKNPGDSNWFNTYPPLTAHEKMGTYAWRTKTLMLMGINHRKNQSECPVTMEALKVIPGLTLANFSLMEPGTHILPHVGYTRMVLRSHLGLIVPDEYEKLGIRVGDQTRHWKEGEVMVFDDSFEHEAWNRSEGVRAVLLFDFANPAWEYTPDEICRYKLQNTNDEGLLKLGTREEWMEWYEQGYFPEDMLI